MVWLTTLENIQFVDRFGEGVGLEYLAGNRLHFYGAAVDGKENVFMLANHTFWCDWMVSFALATRLNKGTLLRKQESLISCSGRHKVNGQGAHPMDSRCEKGCFSPHL